MIDELTDRYGPVPDEVRNLVRFSVLKSLAERIGVESVDRRQGYLNIKFHPQSKVDPLKLMTLVRTAPGAQFTPAGVLAAAGCDRADSGKRCWRTFEEVCSSSPVRN